MLALGGAAAPVEPAAALLARIVAANRGTRTLSGEFVQRKRMNAFERELVSHGQLEYRRPARLVWRYTEPDRSTLVIEGDHATLTLEGEPPQAYDLGAQPALRTLIAQLRLWLGGEGDQARLQEEFTLSSKSSPEGPGLVLGPKNGSLRTRVAQITLVFDSRTLLPRRIEVLEASGDRTQVSFTKLERH